MIRNTLVILPFMLMQAASVFAAETTTQATPRTVIDPLSGTNIFQMVAGLVFVLLLVIVVAWLVRRVSGVNIAGGGALSIVGGMSMGARERVVLLQVGDEQVLIGVSPGRIQTLHVLEKPIEIQPAKGVDMSFANKLAEVVRGKAK